MSPACCMSGALLATGLPPHTLLRATPQNSVSNTPVPENGVEAYSCCAASQEDASDQTSCLDPRELGLTARPRSPGEQGHLGWGASMATALCQGPGPLVGQPTPTPRLFLPQKPPVGHCPGRQPAWDEQSCRSRSVYPQLPLLHQRAGRGPDPCVYWCLLGSHWDPPGAAQGSHGDPNPAHSPCPGGAGVAGRGPCSCACEDPALSGPVSALHVITGPGPE